MAHALSQILDSVETALTGLTTAGPRVFREAVYPHPDSEVPGYRLEWVNDRLIPGSETFGKRETREATLLIEGRTKPSAGTEMSEQRLALLAEAQAALFADRTLNKKVLWSELQESRFDKTGRLERPAGIVEMFILYRYAIVGSDPTVLVYYGGA